MKTTPNGWKVIDEDAGILSYEYRFATAGFANAIAARMANGEMMVISPPSRVSAGVFDDLEPYGKVGAVVANNGFHHLGLPSWKDRFPEARFFAEDTAARRIKKKNSKAPDFESTDALKEISGDDVVFTALSPTKCGEGWLKAKTSDGYVWFTSDILHNMDKLPANFLVRTLFKMTGTRPGFGVFHAAMMVLVKDKKGVLRNMRDDLSAHPPSVIVPGHGAILTDASVGKMAQDVLNKAL
ncbi:MAG: hypothetical protein KC561_07750 [Myxococcales bacterium]|nr:hypothetical protein [Myxococcales bacterium]